MRGRTNINGSGNAVVNGELKEFVVADGEMVGKGDFVQASYKKDIKRIYLRINLVKNLLILEMGNVLFYIETGQTQVR